MTDQNLTYNAAQQGFHKPKMNQVFVPRPNLPSHLPTTTALPKSSAEGSVNKKSLSKQQPNDEEIINKKLQSLSDTWSHCEDSIKKLMSAYEKMKSSNEDFEKEDFDLIEFHVKQFSELQKQTANKYNELKQTNEDMVQALRKKIDNRKNKIAEISKETGFLEVCNGVGEFFLQKSVEHEKMFEILRKRLLSQTK